MMAASEAISWFFCDPSQPISGIVWVSLDPSGGVGWRGNVYLPGTILTSPLSGATREFCPRRAFCVVGLCTSVTPYRSLFRRVLLDGAARG